MQYRILIAGLEIHVESPFEIHFLKESLPFLSADHNSPMVKLIYRLKSGSNIRKSGIVYEAENKSYSLDGTVYLNSKAENKAYAAVAQETDHPLTLVCSYLEKFEYQVNYSRNLYYVFGLESILLNFNALILHASFIICRGYAILFSGPSGIGKSTQAALWEKYENAEIINGDRSAVKREDGRWVTYGLPIAGSSGIYKNRKAPLKAVILLAQDSENNIRKAEPSTAYRYLYPQVLIHRWDHEFENKATQILLSMIQDIPVYELKCRPDYGAVECVKNSLFTGETE